MSVTIRLAYEGELQVSAIHEPSGDRLVTDAPVDNEGRGEHFSPTDLVATALGSCILTIMGIVARRKGIDMSGARVTVQKHMSAVPRRHIGRIDVEIRLPAALDADARTRLERAAQGCPVHASLAPDTRVDVRFVYR